MSAALVFFLFLTLQAVADVNPEALELFRKAEALIGTPKEYSEEQEGYFAQAVRLAPDFLPARHNLALVYLKRGKLDEALAELDGLLSRDPGNINAHLLRADIHIRRKDLDRAGDELAETLALDRNRIDVVEQLGNIRLQQKRYSEAAELLERAARGESASADVFFNLGMALQNLDRKAGAIEAYRRVLALTPDDFQAHVILASLYRKSGDKHSSLTHLLKASSLRPSDSRVAEELGTLYLELGQHEAAQEQLSRTGLESAANLGNLAIAARRQGRYAEAEKHLRAALGKDPREAGLWQYLGDVLALQHKDLEAVDAYREALGLKADDFETLFNLGGIYANLDRLEEARESFKRALAQKPSSGQAHLNLAIVLDRLNQEAPARDHYLAAIQNGADESQAHFRLGVLYARLPDVEKSIRHLGIAFEREPEKYVPLVREEIKNVHSDLDAIRYTKAFNALMGRYLAKPGPRLR